MADYFKRVQAQTQTRFWINNVTNSEADMAIEAGASGCTQNPSYTWKMLTHPVESEKNHALNTLKDILKEEKNDTEALVKLQRTLVGEIAKHFLPMWEATGGSDGYVSIQADPFDETYETIMRTAHFNREAGPNIMIKIPATGDGIKAIEQCTREGIPTNCTEVMSLAQTVDVIDAYERGAKGLKNPPVSYISHIAGIFDQYLGMYVKENNIDISADSMFLAGKICAQKVRDLMDKRRTPMRLINGGARGLQHFTEWVGCDCSNTINWIGTADKLIELDGPVVPRFDTPVPSLVLDELLTKLEPFSKAYFLKGLTIEDYEEFGPVELFRSSFCKSWSSALKLIKELRG